VGEAGGVGLEFVEKLGRGNDATFLGERPANNEKSRLEAFSNRQSTMYSPQVLDHFEHPRNVGEVADPDASVQMENPVCGDVLKLTLKLAGGRVEEIRFLAKGCVPSIACGSALTELTRGRTVAEARELGGEELVRKIGGLPAASSHASHLALDALAAALNQLPPKI
jgi:nitrogen fixation protein NifU and related proteins